MAFEWNGRRVLVTGATGLVGFWLIRRLVAAGSQVVALVRDADPQSEFFRTGLDQHTSMVWGSLENYRDVERAVIDHETDTVYHLGAQTIVGTACRNPLVTFETNVRGTWNLLEVCRLHSDLVKRVVVASSDKAYGAAESLPYHESMPTLGRYPYDVSKSCADLIAQSYFHTYRLPVAIARCGNVYGGGDFHFSRLIPGAIRSLLRGEAPVIRSDGRSLRDYVYVDDVVRGYLMLAEAMERPEVTGHAFNFAASRPYSVIEIVDLLRTISGRTDLEPVIVNAAKSEIKDQYLSTALAAFVLGWTARYGIEQGLGATWDWYREHFGRALRAVA